jgi:hypothetical protein
MNYLIPLLIFQNFQSFYLIKNFLLFTIPTDFLIHLFVFKTSILIL